MARIRTIKPEFFSHEILAGKSAHARLLAIGLLTLADCEGRLRWVPMQVHAQVFPWEASVNIEALLGELIAADYVVHYEVDGKRYVEVANFKKHQRLSGKEAAYQSRLPGPNEADEKTNDFVGENGEANGKHPGTSPGSNGNPLGTGEQGNIGTGEHRSSRPKSAANFTGEDFDLATWMFTKVTAVAPKLFTHPTKRSATIENWANTIRLMRERDGRTFDEIKTVFRWANEDSFWKANILSADKLREQFANLDAKMRSPVSKAGKQAGIITADYEKQW